MSININAIIDTISVIMVFVVFISMAKQGRETDGRDTLFKALAICVMTVLMLDIPAWLLDGINKDYARAACITLDTLFYMVQIVYCRLWLLFVDKWISGRKPRKPITRFLFSIPMIVEIVLIIANLWNGYIFTISPENIYTRGEFYYINLVPYYFYIIVAIVFASYSANKSRGTGRHRQDAAIVIYMLLPICGVIIETVNYGVSWLWPFTAISLLMIYMNIQTKSLSDERVSAALETQKTAELENQLANSRVKIMLSQIQPHFLYNSLAVIQALCETEPRLAARATEDFAIYLRCNMDSLNTDTTIPFEKELQHTMRYLSLEKLRFQDGLTIDYDIKAKDFCLPALTLQPIAENAVRNGISKRENGGHLQISTEETEKDFVITVEDTGVGFDQNKKKTDAKSHIGIDNVRSRLQTMCGGGLNVESTPNIGTKAVIWLPKVDKED